MRNNWIKLSGGEPNVNEPVLAILARGDYCVACLRIIERLAGKEYSHWEIARDVYMAYTAVAYWMPLPEPPEVDNG
jgi:hypothetical protein